MRAAALPALLALLAAGCSEGDPVEAVVSAAVQSAEDQDADDFAKLLADDFRGANDATRSDVVGMVRRYLAAYDTLDVGLSNLETERRGDFASASFRVRMTGVGTKLGGLAALVPENAVYDIEIDLREQDGRWLITRASWREVN